MNLTSLLEPVSAAQPDVTINLATASAEADTLQEGKAVFYGNVRLDTTGLGQNVQNVLVKLEAETSRSDWDASISPVQMIFDMLGDDSQPFEAYIAVPKDASAYDNGSLIVSGTAQPQPGAITYDITPVYGTVDVLKYAMADWEGNPHRTGKAGDKVQFKLNILNLGNYDETFKFSVKKAVTEITGNWGVSFSEDKLSIPEKGKKELKVDISIPKDISEGEYAILILVEKAFSENIENTFVLEFNLLIEVEPGVLGTGFVTAFLIIIIVVLVVALIIWRTKKSGKKKNK